MALSAKAAGFRRGRSGERGRISAGSRDPSFRLRALWLLAAALLLASLIWGRLVYWQVAQHSKLAGDALSQYSKVIELPATRGMVYDRNGQPLAINEVVYSVFISPDQVPRAKRDAVAQGVSSATGKPVEEIQALLASKSKFAYIARRQPKAAADRLKALHLPGVGLEPESQRSYLPGGSPNTTLAANLLGFVNHQGIGQYGVEAFYQQELAGRSGSMSTFQDLAGREIIVGGESRREPVQGADLQLTIDANIQHAVEQALAEGVIKNKAESGSIIVMDPHTGGIIAWADYPTYNANDFARTSVDKFIDPIVSHLYEPGSTMKVVTLAGALDNHAITPGMTIIDPGYITVGGVTLHDWDRANKGMISFTKVLESSLNVGAIRALQMEGKDAFYRNLGKFGFATPSRIDVAAESASPLRSQADYRDSEMATMAYGQGINSNMVQMISAINVVPNGGRSVQPHVVERVGGRPSLISQTPSQVVVAPDTAAQMNEMMKAVVQRGSGHEARIEGFQNDEGGKTGTSQMPIDGKYGLDVWSSYVGYMPASDPRFTMLVVIRKPHNESWILNDGYIVAAPIWKKVAQSIVLQWHIAPTPGR